MDVYYASAIDRAPRNGIITVGLVFPAVEGTTVNVNALREALFKVIQDKLPRAATRIVKSNGRVEYHIPRHFDEQTTPTAFSSTILMDDLLPAGVVPQVQKDDGAQEVPVIMLDDLTVARHFRGPQCPTKIDGFLKPGIPASQAHVGVYKDGWLIGLTLAHVVFDAEAAGVILRSWAAATRGELDTVVASPRDYSPLQTDAITVKAAELGETFESKRDHGFRLVSFLSLLAFLVQYVWWLIRAGPQENILIRIPKDWARKQKELANAVLAKKDRKESTGPTFVSTNDILTAFLFKVCYAHRTDSQLQNLLVSIDLRRALPASFLTSKSFINNAVTSFGPSPVPANVLATDPLSTSAIRLRGALDRFRSGPVAAEIAFFCQKSDAGTLLLPAPPGQWFSIASSWLQSKFSTVEFALDPPKTAESERKTAQPVYVSGYFIERPMDLGLVVSEDKSAYWATWQTSKKNLRQIQDVMGARGDAYFMF